MPASQQGLQDLQDLQDLQLLGYDLQIVIIVGRINNVIVVLFSGLGIDEYCVNFSIDSACVTPT